MAMMMNNPTIEPMSALFELFFSQDITDMLIQLLFGSIIVIAALTKAQRSWVLRRDGHRCQFFENENGEWVQCKTSASEKKNTGLHAHHIWPNRFAHTVKGDDYDNDGPENLLTLCKEH